MVEVRLARGAEHLAALGPRAIAEFLAELGRVHGIDEDILAHLDRWREHLTPELLRAVGGDRFAFPLAVVPEDLP